MTEAATVGKPIVRCELIISSAPSARSGAHQARLLGRADIISLHCPLLPATRHMINAESIAKMKPGVILINTARGPLIKETDLIAALQSGRVVGAGLDVFEKEPLPVESPLRSLPNVLLTSHAASVSVRAVEQLQTKAAEAARDILLGRRPEGLLA